MPENVCAADVRANELVTSLTTGQDFTLPDVNLSLAKYNLPGDTTAELFQILTRLTDADLTTGTLNGTGTFDALMRAFKAHLQDEYEKNRITGAEYTKSYIALTQAAMANATQYLLGRDQAFWGAQNAQIQAINALVQLEIAKAQYAVVRYEALNAEAMYARTKMEISNLSAEFCIKQYNLNSLMPAQLAQLTQQTANLVSEKAITDYNLSDMLPAQKARLVQETTNLATENDIQTFNLDNMLPMQLTMLTAQKDHQLKETEIADYNLDSILPAQLAKLTSDKLAVDKQIESADYTLDNILPEQFALTKEQVETQRSQTLDTRRDAAPVVGSIGKQKDLYDQQITSYQRDVEIKAGKMYLDSWITQKTIDEGLVPPTAFTNAIIDSVFASIKTNAGL